MILRMIGTAAAVKQVHSQLDQLNGIRTKQDKKFSYPQRKCASNVAILYGADGISI